jgi:Tfp pilus assembly protein PilF
MEQGEAVRQGIGEYVLKTSKPPRIPVQHSSAVGANTEGFYDAWEEARLAHYGDELRRAHYYYDQALKTAPEDVGPETLADIIQGLKEVKQSLACDEATLPRLRAAVEEDPVNSERRCRYASLLWRIGREDEAAQQLEAALEHPETLCQDCLRDCWNNLGWYLYRKGEYAKALPWLERAAKVKRIDPVGNILESPHPIENIILVYVALNMALEAEKAAVHYIANFGRLPWPERRALRKLNIDADALYIKHCGHTV